MSKVYLTYNGCADKFEAYTVAGCGNEKNYLRSCGQIRQWNSRCRAEQALKAEGYADIQFI